MKGITSYESCLVPEGIGLTRLPLATCWFRIFGGLMVAIINGSFTDSKAQSARYSIYIIHKSDLTNQRVQLDLVHRPNVQKCTFVKFSDIANHHRSFLLLTHPLVNARTRLPW